MFIKVFILFFANFFLHSQVVPYTDNFLRDAKYDSFKGSISFSIKQKSFLDKEENRIITAKQFATLQMIYYFKNKNKIHISQELEELIVLNHYEDFLKNFEVTEVVHTNFKNLNTKAFDYIGSYFAYRTFFLETEFDKFLGKFYDFENEIFSSKILSVNDIKKIKIFDEKFFKEKYYKYNFCDNHFFKEYIFYPKLKNNPNQFSKNFYNIFYTLLKNELKAENNYKLYEKESDKFFSKLSDDKDSVDREEQNQLSYEDDSRKTPNAKNVKEKKSLSTLEKTMVIYMLKNRKKKR